MRKKIGLVFEVIFFPSSEQRAWILQPALSRQQRTRKKIICNYKIDCMKKWLSDFFFKADSSTTRHHFARSCARSQNLFYQICWQLVKETERLWCIKWFGIVHQKSNSFLKRRVIDSPFLCIPIYMYSSTIFFWLYSRMKI